MTTVGRNELCPCGSGKKYKKCCMNADQAKSAATGAKKYLSPDWDFINRKIAPPDKFRQSEDFAWFVYAGLKPDDEIELGRMVVSLYGKLKDLPPHERIAALYEMYEAKTDEVLARDTAAGKAAITCHAGCANCCKQAIRASDEEVDYIFEFMAKNGIEIAFDAELLDHQVAAARQVERMGDQAEWRRQLSPDQQDCVFLDPSNGLCRIYEARPLNCRNYFSISDNRFCALTPTEIPAADRHLKNQINFIELAQLATAYLNISGPQNTYRNLAVAVRHRIRPTAI